MRLIRDLLAGLFVLLAPVFALLSFLGFFAGKHVTDEAGFLQITSPVASEPGVQAAFTESAQSALTSQVDLGLFQPQLESMVDNGAATFLSSEAYQEVWDLSLQGMHRDLLSNSEADIAINLRPLWDSVAEPINDFLPFGWSLPQPEITLLSLSTMDASWMDQVQILAFSAPIFAGVALVSVLGAILIASRRVLILALAALFTAGLSGTTWWVTLNLLKGKATEYFGANYQPQLLQLDESAVTAGDLGPLITTHIIENLVNVFTAEVTALMPMVAIISAVLALILGVLAGAVKR